VSPLAKIALIFTPVKASTNTIATRLGFSAAK
jgi:hypothetical protein